MFDWEALPDCCQPSDGADSAGTDADRGQDGGVDAAAPATTVAATAVAEQAEVVSPSAVHRPDVGLWWRVVHTGPVNVRKKPSLQSRILGSKKPDAEVRGQAEEGWLRLLDEEGFMRISADFCPFLMRATACVGDFKWVGASNIFDQLEQELAGARSDLPHKDRIVPPLPPLPPRPVPTLAPPPRGRRAPAETAGGGDGDAEGAAGGSGPDDAEEEEPHITVNLAQGTQDLAKAIALPMGVEVAANSAQGCFGRAGHNGVALCGIPVACVVAAVVTARIAEAAVDSCQKSDADAYCGNFCRQMWPADLSDADARSAQLAQSRQWLRGSFGADAGGAEWNTPKKYRKDTPTAESGAKEGRKRRSEHDPALNLVQKHYCKALTWG
mmetsp:Transcript_91241/g.294972  ORF Transcript_91241/g.294972 Transcript_91241/m.294972 type:complete len:383 (-) Transcript_91241:232-1380(-)